MTTYDILKTRAVRLSPSGQTILVLWGNISHPCRCDIHLCTSGDRVATFYPPGIGVYEMPSMAFLAEDRLVIAAPSSFQVYMLPMGQSEGTTRPCNAPVCEDQRPASIVTVNPAGTKLAFLPVCCSTVFLYNAYTTAPLGTVQLDGYTWSPGRNACGLIWGVYSWVVFIDCPRHDVTGECMQALQVFRPQAGCCSCSEVLKCEDQPEQDCACSPDGRFMCAVHDSDGAGITVSVHDILSGKVVRTQAVCLPDDVQQLLQQPFSGRSKAVWWSSCGYSLLVQTSVWAHDRISAYLTVLQF